MRKWLVVFMLFLLPLRGLVGDAMAYSMVLSSPLGTVAVHAYSMEEKVDFDHARSAVVASNLPCHTDAIAIGDAEPTQNQCTSCQVCHLGALAEALHAPDLLQHAAVAPEQSTALWHSAEPRLLAKTPVR